jgi:hypothetical protein
MLPLQARGGARGGRTLVLMIIFININKNKNKRQEKQKIASFSPLLLPLARHEQEAGEQEEAEEGTKNINKNKKKRQEVR